jgi:hypothetical protein
LLSAFLLTYRYVKVKITAMKYKVHRIDVKRDAMQDKLENFINHLDGEIISIIPDVRPTFQFMGATAKVDFLLIVEKRVY